MKIEPARRGRLALPGFIGGNTGETSLRREPARYGAGVREGGEERRVSKEAAPDTKGRPFLFSPGSPGSATVDNMEVAYRRVAFCGSRTGMSG